MTITTCDWPECRETEGLRYVMIHTGWADLWALLWIVGVFAFMVTGSPRLYCPTHYKLILPEG